MEVHVEKLKKEEPIANIATYRHPHHRHEHQQTCSRLTWNHRSPQYRGTWRIESNEWRYYTHSETTWH
jgi:hypothetical protein